MSDKTDIWDDEEDRQGYVRDEAPRRAAMTDKTELLPCPFCGCAPIAVDAFDGTNTVICSNCGVSTARFRAPEYKIADAIAAWNRRSSVQEAAPAVTDDMCRAAIKAMQPDRIQGFSYGPGFSAPHVIRDVFRNPDQQEIWRGDSHDEMMERCRIEEMRLGLAAAISAARAVAPAGVVALPEWPDLDTEIKFRMAVVADAECGGGGIDLVGELYEMLREALSAAPTPTAQGQGWQDIASAPKKGWDSPILTCRMGPPASYFGDAPVAGYAEPPEAAYWNEDGGCWTPTQRPHDHWHPTHWMPLPSAPSTSAGEAK